MASNFPFQFDLDSIRLNNIINVVNTIFWSAGNQICKLQYTGANIYIGKQRKSTKHSVLIAYYYVKSPGTTN